MVCDACEKKITAHGGSVACPDKWKDGASNSHGKSGNRLGENKLLSKKSRYTPYATLKCTACKTALHKEGHTYCHGCAYQKGLCEMCGKKLLEVGSYKMKK
mmetsp:Transcript_21865/g.37365  ORF Transcript_21865/g.37365 Transcript_21865/m.37365 type:complete len:101 (+) Transcript_21865:181-483(+)|eukprot:CAMPEP_0119109152 /NCGR_PEP_ID=MMETSP1180-20130426/17457_1 /TAXON_ID=3052 ORGANISM="Chlamydomonas cf sp, Strain CCMP681" /NCGR_SAMPLE_ID=MMETSP1180 /ASSEMBLY_ACC=CAM_ASM_000741 /LENGTH=100 /DNA_ID=CAMNT_0007094869 /DNA_START=156 /DNA_END=458 /DNA_ORIENTATION=+